MELIQRRDRSGTGAALTDQGLSYSLGWTVQEVYALRAFVLIGPCLEGAGQQSLGSQRRPFAFVSGTVRPKCLDLAGAEHVQAAGDRKVGVCCGQILQHPANGRFLSRERARGLGADEAYRVRIARA